MRLPAFLLLTGASLFLMPSAVDAKSNYLVSVTLRVNGDTTFESRLQLPTDEDLDPLWEMSGFGMSEPSELPYRVVLHHDFDEWGARDWAGYFDGRDTFYFPEDMVVNRGVWAAGWYQGAPPLVDPLQREIKLRQLDLGLRTPEGSTGRTAAALIALASFGFTALAAAGLNRRAA
jgi:hypothetical protein